MGKKIMKYKDMMCPCCMEEHEVQVVEVQEQNIFKQVQVGYLAKYFYCEKVDEYYTDETMLQENDISMKNAYRKEMGLLTSDEISAIRERYKISQGDLCYLLGWGGKTITRYEGHQVQDAAHDIILRKLSDDPEWFLSLLETSRKTLPDRLYLKYHEMAISRLGEKEDCYLRKAILAKYARFCGDISYHGNIHLSLDVVVDVIRYFSNTTEMVNLYREKLMKILWYSDALSYKRREHAITGLIYQASSAGVVPLAYDFILDLRGIKYEEIDREEGISYQLKGTDDKEYRFLTKEDTVILDEIVRIFGKSGEGAMLCAMQKEQACIETASRDFISFEHTKALSIS